MVDFALTLVAERLHDRHGWRQFAGTGVLVISACMGESPRKHKTEDVTRTSSLIEASQAETPSCARRLKFQCS
jgi:hypothetical protein